MIQNTLLNVSFIIVWNKKEKQLISNRLLDHFAPIVPDYIISPLAIVVVDGVSRQRDNPKCLILYTNLRLNLGTISLIYFPNGIPKC